MKHVIVYKEPGRFCGWPANNGVWNWDGNEILVGFSLGTFREQKGHNIEDPILSVLARSVDGGESWVMYDPQDFVGDGGEATDPPGDIDFSNPDLALRVTGIGFHGNVDPRGGYFASQDRGVSWSGPFKFSGLLDDPRIKGFEMTPRTDTLALSASDCLFFLSARDPSIKIKMHDRAFCARTSDGGASFRFCGWIVGFDDPYRGVMPSTVRMLNGSLVSAVRRRRGAEQYCWVDAYASDDLGETWRLAGKVGDTGTSNGNPPALVALSDGRVCCVYGNRDRREMIARLSADGGLTWGEEVVLRDDFQADAHDDADFGYPRVVQRGDGRLVAMYYWATRENIEHHIAATIWEP
jgi:hypothetical protein